MRLFIFFSILKFVQFKKLNWMERVDRDEKILKLISFTFYFYFYFVFIFFILKLKILT